MKLLVIMITCSKKLKLIWQNQKLQALIPFTYNFFFLKPVKLHLRQTQLLKTKLIWRPCFSVSLIIQLQVFFSFFSLGLLPPSLMMLFQSCFSEKHWLLMDSPEEELRWWNSTSSVWAAGHYWYLEGWIWFFFLYVASTLAFLFIITWDSQ